MDASQIIARALTPLIGLAVIISPFYASAQQPPSSVAVTRPGPSANPIAGSEGGAAQADFDSLIDLIESTVAPESWEANGTGEGSVAPFALNGVFVDARGQLRVAAARDPAALVSLRRQSAPEPKKERQSVDARTTSPLRFVSLPRLEEAIAERQRNRQPLEPAMLTLAGLQRIAYVFVYPESRDLVVAGPAGDWQADGRGRLVAVETGQPVVRLDDLLTLWRRQQTERGAAFGCSINPRQEALAKTQAYLAASAATPIEPGNRRDWLNGLRDQVGEQDVEFFNVDPETRIAGLLLAADYHMKLIGMGLEDGVPGVRSYLSSVKLDANGAPPPMSVLRWWFSMPNSEVTASARHDAFAMPTNCVQVLSENELLAARGRRVHTGQSDELNSRFAESFTSEYEALSEKYPVYAELRRVFELSLALAVIQSEGLAEMAQWEPTLLLDAERLRLPRVVVPLTVQTVVNHRILARRHVIAGVSGGVWIDGRKNVKVASGAEMLPEKIAPAALDAWWWD